MNPTEIVVLSGKGGTGKTSLTAAFTALAAPVVTVDCDVDAPDLQWVLAPTPKFRHRFYSGWEAVIDETLCRSCGRCAMACRFSAIARSNGPGSSYRVDPLSCEGCGVCQVVCPRNAVSLKEAERGEWLQSDTRFGPLLHPHMKPGAENSGKLVSQLRERAKAVAREGGYQLIICDGPPGIGCPVIATISGATHVVLVTEPGQAAHHDLERVANLAGRFRVPISLFLNKADLDPAEAAATREFAQRRGFPIIGEAPYDPTVTAAQLQGRAVTELNSRPVADAIRAAWLRLNELLRRQNTTRLPIRIQSQQRPE